MTRLWPNGRALGIGLAAILPALGGCGLWQRSAPQPPPVIITQAPILLADGAAERAPMPPPSNWVPLAAPAPILADAGAPPLIGPPPAPAHRSEGGDERREDVPAIATNNAPATTPQLSAGLSPQQQANYRRSVMGTLSQTQSDLKALYNRSLNGEAAATRSQASEYVRQAQQALADGDMIRAQTLAAKAQTLVQFLLGR